jgi:tRNA(fMet)-specific endonuclease VapC
MYLLDTNICVFYLKNRCGLSEKINQAGWLNCFISEITLAELKFGAENSQLQAQNRLTIAQFQTKIQVLPIFSALDFYAREKARLRQRGTPIDDFDLLIAASAVTNGLIMVTNNLNHFNRVDGIVIEDWTQNI